MTEWRRLIFIINMGSVAAIFGISYILFGSRFALVYLLVPLLGVLHSLAVVLIERIHIPWKFIQKGTGVIGVLLFLVIDMLILKYLPMFHLPGKHYPLVEPFLISVLSVVSLVVGVGLYFSHNFKGLP
ncbi:MAG: hypothetical protein GY801_36060 [bacterium]|nr:hypothetical protein [bacterium]